MPAQTHRRCLQGLLKVLVDASGKLVRAMIERSSGSRLLDDSASKHVLAAWRFPSAMRDGQAVEAWALVPVRFDFNRG